ncbi:hypothetical protein Pcinc_042171 [Petrolisthes cinctipes]|uniref:SNRNP25 ubiquitin-like domain-containing protein n=1 Tax=Petrolisthes cinctipes TaxID=88211 RepID=A0AAE1EH70_PETCI|nr:hypothetical protein Pcinc_042171 [Petrolisthes cinctipes]
MESKENGDFGTVTTIPKEKYDHFKPTTPDCIERDAPNAEYVEEKEKADDDEKKVSIEEKGGENEAEDPSEDSKTLSHPELKLFFQEALARVLQTDPLLADLHPQVTPEEVNALIELEHGRAMRVWVEREGGDESEGEKAWGLVVSREDTVHQLKQSLRHHVALVLSRQGIKKRISWKYVWKSNWLSYEGTRLTDDNAKLHQYGIRNKSTLRFVKKYRDKQKFGRRKK